MLLSVCGAAITLAAAYGLGSVVTRRAAGAAASIAVGSALLSLAIFAVMAAHVAHTPVLTALTTACLLLNMVRVPSRVPGVRVPAWVFAALAPFAVYALANALAPEIEADANVYHLKPAIDAQMHGGFSPIVSFYDRLPQAMELLYINPYRIGGVPSARLLHLSLLAATLPVVARLALFFGLSLNAAWIAAVVYGITPVVIASGTAAFNDAALVFATVTSLTVLLTGGPVWIAGLIAGFCFGIKMTGGIVIAAGLGWLAWNRRWRDVVLFGVYAGAMMAPWVLRNLIQIHNPFAPFGNQWFPNPLFHISTEQSLAETLRSYGLGFWQRFPEILWGGRLHGIIGPMFVLAPVALLALRKRHTAVLVAFAAVLSVPWWLNAGTRFLGPALPFLIVGLVGVLPSRVLPLVLAVHAVTSWPLAITWYEPRTWHLHEFPWRAAIGVESGHDYLWRTNRDYHWAKLVEANTPANARILDLHGVHSAHIRRDLIVWWHSAWSENAASTLEFARQPGEEKLFEARASFSPQMVRGVRIRPGQASGGPWSVVEVELSFGRDPVGPLTTWALSAKPNRWETPLAFDRNLATRWQSWQPTEPRQWLAADLVEAVQLDTVRVVSTRWDAGNTRLAIDVQQPSGTWFAADATNQELGALDLRQSAMRYVKRLGFTHIVGRAGQDGTQVLMHSLADNAAGWGVDVIAEEDTFYVLKVK